MAGMEPQTNRPDVDLILFDLDNTLYPRDLGLWRLIDDRIRAFVARELNLPPEEAEIVQKRYWIEHGTTLVGLMKEHGMDPAPYLADVHDVAVQDHLQPNPVLNDILTVLPYRKAIFTNATATHAQNVLEALDIVDHFEMLVGMDEVGYLSKPNPVAYERCLDMLGLPADRCIFIEDSPVNLVPARAMGMKTVLVGQAEQNHADYTINRIEDIGQIFR
jgi:putative hydrolase of the HAD superfamily